MPVIQRIQRLHPLGREAGDPQASAYLVGESMPGRAMSPATLRTVCLVAADMLAFVLVSVAAGLASSALGAGPTGDLPTLLIPVSACILAGLVAYLSAREHYDHRVPFTAEIRDLAMASGAALVAASAAAFLLDFPLPRPPLVSTALLFPPSALALRGLARSALDAAGLWRMKVVLVGEGNWAGRAAADLVAHPELGYEVVAHAAPPLAVAGLPNWARLLRQHRAEMLVLAYDTNLRLSPELVAGLVRERVPYALLPQMDGLPVVGTRRTVLSQEATLLTYRNNLRKPVSRALKIGFDLMAAGAALLVLAPVLLLIAAVVGLDGGPIFFAHPRIGARGRVFQCLKFRSMVVDGDTVLQRVLASDPAAAEEWAHTHKLKIDPRVTWIGRILRKTSLDELPQLINVLRLEMSLVGPRPIVSLEIPKYAEDIAYYYETRPGITGLWQVSGRSDTTYAHRVWLDSWYVRNWSLWHDLSILARTIPAVISGRGAG